MNDPETIGLEQDNNDDGIITVYVKGKKFLVSPSEAVSIINQISGVLLAYEYTGRREQGQKKYNDRIPTPGGVNIRP